MRMRVFPAAALAAILLSGAGFAPVAAQETVTQTPQAVPATATADQPVQLSSRAQEILKLVRAQVHDEVTVAFIQNGNCRYNLSASEIIYLRKEGVSDRVLTAMLNPTPSVEAQPLPQSPPTAPVTAASGTAPQEYAAESEAPAAVDTASTLYVVPSTTYYYSYSSPWYYGWYWPWYPYYGYSWGWGNCYYGHYDNCHGHSGYYPYSGYSGYYPYGNTSANGNTPARYEVSPNSGSGRSAGAAPREQVTRAGNNGGNPTVPGASGPQANSSRTQVASQTSNWGGSRGSRSVAASPNQVTGGAQLANGSQPGASRTVRSATDGTASRGSPSSGRNTVWANSNSRMPTSRVSSPSSTVSVPRSSPASPTTRGNRTVSQPASRYVAGSSPSYQRSASPSYNYRSTTSFSPSPSTSSGGSRSMSTYQGGRSFGGASAPRVSSMPSGGGGGFRGGGGGGHR